MLCLGATAARAEGEKTPEYEAAYKAGTELFEAGQYAEARVRFLEAHAIYPEPLLLLNIGSTFRREDNAVEALDYYKRYLAEARPDDEYRDAARKLVDELEAQIEAETAKPEPPPDPPPPGPTVVVEPEPVRDAPPRPGRALRITGIAGVAVGAILVGVGVQQGLQASSIQDELQGKMNGTEWTDELQDRYDDGEAAEQRAMILGVAGGITIVAGATLYIIGWDRGRKASSERVRVAPYVDGSATGFAVSGSF